MQLKRSLEEGFTYRTFYDVLSERMDELEVLSLRALGTPFFELVEQLSGYLFENRLQDAPLLELTQQDFLWELQVFANRFIRANCESILKLRPFCKNLLQLWKEESFREEFCQELGYAYELYFFVSEIEEESLV